MLDEDQSVAVVLLERQEELRVDVRSLRRRLKELEAAGASVQEDMANYLGLRRGGVGPAPYGAAVEDIAEKLWACRWRSYELTATALGDEYNAADVALWCERALEMGAAHPRIDENLLLDLLHVRKVPNERFRNRLTYLLDHGHAMTALVIGVHRHLLAIEEARGESYGAASLMSGRRPQTRLVERWLGITATPVKLRSKNPSLRLFITYEQAEAFASALGMDPHQAGI
jgi:hypothetical protein